LAGHFYARHQFDVFLRLVPWNDFVGIPNKGHAAIGDFLITRAAHAALSANVDPMIERWAEEHRVALEGALTGQEAVALSVSMAPLVKFHGCMRKAKATTLWTQAQLAEEVIRTRTRSCSEWMRLNLPGKHLVVVGFWTDWGYLNDVLAESFTIENAASVTVIDIGSSADLAAKAPQLWEKLNRLSNSFLHVQESAAAALDEIRTAYSKTWARRYYQLAEPLVLGSGARLAAVAPFDGLSGEDLYNLRRDAEGVPYTGAAQRKAPAPEAAQAAFTHALFLNAGAAVQGAWLQHNRRTIRVVSGAGQAITTVRGRYKEPPVLRPPDVVVCAGAFDVGVPTRVIADGRGASAVRPAPGGGAEWLTLEQAYTDFGL
jgi:hypothetical protein